MVLDTLTIQKIQEFVHSQPRTIQDVALLIKKDWKTALRYVEKIALENGTLSTKTFRGGTRGALKIVFWNNLDKFQNNRIQETLQQEIKSGKKKYDFSPLDIYQHVEKDKDVFQEETNSKEISEKEDLVNLLRSAKKQLLIFSGNVSFINLKQGNVLIKDIIEELVKNKVSVKVLSRVDVASVSNLEKLKEIDHKLGKNGIEVRHNEQPLRGFIVDNQIVRLKEEKVPEVYKEGELKKPTTVFYTIQDEEWVDWLQKVFWNMFRTSIDAEKRLVSLKGIF